MSSALMRALLISDWDSAGQLLGAEVPADWRREDWQWLGRRPDHADADPSVVPWLPRVMLLRTIRETGKGHPIVVGEAGFHGLPDDDGRAEIGYMVISEHRRCGYAEEAARALIDWAAAAHHITRFRASVSPQNAASLSLVRKLGFIQVGIDHHDRRGEELIFHRDSVDPSTPRR
jgi:[ribosomal protein S5]-alanine N-acetyltransferase